MYGFYYPRSGYDGARTVVYEPCGQSNKHSSLDFCTRAARKETNTVVASTNSGY